MDKDARITPNLSFRYNQLLNDYYNQKKNSIMD